MRKPIQLLAMAIPRRHADGERFHHDMIVALCDDGTIWLADTESLIKLDLTEEGASTTWDRLPAVPQYDSPLFEEEV